MSKKGDVLAILVQELLDAQLAQNDASLARAEAAISQTRSQIVEATARLAEAQANFERAKPLKTSGYLSGTTYDQREAAAKSAAAQLTAAQDGLKACRSREEAGRGTAPRADVEAHQYASDGTRRRPYQPRAPRASAAWLPALPTRCSASSPAARSELDAEVIETELAKVTTGKKARVNVAGVGDVEGTVRLVSPEVDKLTRLGRVRMFLGDDPRLRIGRSPAAPSRPRKVTASPCRRRPSSSSRAAPSCRSCATAASCAAM